jgi:hypothetical protein
MRKANFLWGAIIAFSLGASTSGCSAPAPDPSLGSFCAASTDGRQRCVSTNQGPAAAWNQVSKSMMPIQMWAIRPEGVTLDQLLSDKHRLDLWLDDINTVLTYVRDTQKNAESYKASLEGNLGALLAEAEARQLDQLKQDPEDAVRNFKQAYDGAHAPSYTQERAALTFGTARVNKRTRAARVNKRTATTPACA